MTYRVKEIFYTLQGEGLHTGRPAVFVRFSGCNLWSGREEHRGNAECQFCDTDFLKGRGYDTAENLAKEIISHWPRNSKIPAYVVLTGGEPALQIDKSLIDALHQRRAIIAIETNGTKPLPDGLDWICVSPKAGTTLMVTRGDELKLVFPQKNLPPYDVISLDFKHFLLQPLDGEDKEKNTRLAIEYCRANPLWRLSLQTHKILDIP